MREAPRPQCTILVQRNHLTYPCRYRQLLVSSLNPAHTQQDYSRLS